MKRSWKKSKLSFLWNIMTIYTCLIELWLINYLLIVSMITKLSWQARKHLLEVVFIMNIAMIKTAAYKSLVKRSNVTTFAIIITKINRLLKTARNKLKDVNIQELSHEEILKEVKAKLSLKYHDYLDVFDWAMTDQLSSHRFYDHKIELIDEKTSSRSHLYHMSDYKLQKMKNYLIKHLNKDFIFFSSASYTSLILFIKKKDDSLRFCINYRKLNAFVTILATHLRW